MRNPCVTLLEGARLTLAAALLAATGGCMSSTPAVASRDSAAGAQAHDAGAAVGGGDDETSAAPGEGVGAAPAPAGADGAGPELAPPAQTPAVAVVGRQVAKPVVSEYAEGVPPVLLSAGHSKLCKVKVGDVIPTIELPLVAGGNGSLQSLYGAKATVVVFWTADAWMSADVLADLARLGPIDGVAMVGVAVGIKPDAAQAVLAKAGAKFPQLLDEQGVGLAQVGAGLLPRIYVLDSQQRVAWFDVEYSEATRRELRQTLAALTK
jgi:hypothetical protein